MPLYLPQFSSVQSLSRVRLFVTPWIAARQATLSITNSWSSLRLTSIKSVMPSSQFPLLLKLSQDHILLFHWSKQHQPFHLPFSIIISTIQILSYLFLVGEKKNTILHPLRVELSCLEVQHGRIMAENGILRRQYGNCRIAVRSRYKAERKVGWLLYSFWSKGGLNQSSAWSNKKKGNLLNPLKEFIRPDHKIGSKM